MFNFIVLRTQIFHLGSRDKIFESSGLSKVKIREMSELIEFLNKLQPLDTFQVVAFPNVILLCGGPSNNTTPSSFRNLLKNNDIFKNYIQPEDIKEWNQFDLYSDLLTFEEDLGSIISSVVLFVESEGSIAELGAFSKIPSINDKLLVIIDEKYYNQDSFIKLGPIKYLENKCDNSIIVCDFLERGIFSEEKCKNCIPDVKTEIESFTKVFHKAKFNKDNISHLSLLIYEILTYFNILTLSEIKLIFKHLSITVDTDILKRCFFLLDKMELVLEKKYIRQNYYIPCKRSRYVKLSFQKNCFVDKSKFATEYIDNMPKNDNKYKAYIHFERTTL